MCTTHKDKVNEELGAWRWIYIVSALVAFYFNVFVAIVQSFQKFPL